MLLQTGPWHDGVWAEPSPMSDGDLLVAAAESALRAPSVRNSQPWRWVASGATLHLYADRRFHLRVSDPDAHMLLLSCGIALHHAVVAITAAGRTPAVERLPDTGDADHLATLRIAGPHPVTSADRELLHAVQRRRTDRRPVSATPLAGGVLDELRASVSAGYWLHLLRADQVVDLAVMVENAQVRQVAVPGFGEEVATWTGGGHAERGLRADVLVNQPTAAEGVPGRDILLGQSGGLPAPALARQTAVYTVLYGATDNAAGWFAAGEAASVLWLTATMLDLSVMPISDVVEIPVTRAELRRLLAGTGWPYLVFRFGLAGPGLEAAPTARRAAAEVVERVAD